MKPESTKKSKPVHPRVAKRLALIKSTQDVLTALVKDDNRGLAGNVVLFLHLGNKITSKDCENLLAEFGLDP